MKTKSIFNIFLFAVTASFLVACGGGGSGSGSGGGTGSGSGSSNGYKEQASQEEVKKALDDIDNPADKKNSVLGKKVAETKGDIIYGVPENHPHGSATMVVAVTPYEQGFKVFFHSLLDDDPEHMCSKGYVVQKGQVMSFGRIADNQYEFVNDNRGTHYKGYVESGVSDSCGDYDKDTVWVVAAPYISGFDPLEPYTFIIHVSAADYDDIVRIDVSIDDKTDETKVNLKYLGKELSGAVTKPAYESAYPSKKLAFNATITPYEKGFKVFVPKTDSQMCFSIDSAVYQDGFKYEMGVTADSWYEYYENEPDDYDAYVESGFFDSCSDLPVDTTYVVEAVRVGFDPEKPYTVKLGSVNIDPDTDKRQAFDIKPKK